MQKYNPVGWFEIYVDDLSRAKKFYETVFEHALTSMSDPSVPHIQMEGFPMEEGVMGASGALVKMEGVKAGGNSTVVYFGSQDCATEEARVAAAGGKVFKPKMSIGQYGFISLCFDTEGNMFGIHSMQ